VTPRHSKLTSLACLPAPSVATSIRVFGSPIPAQCSCISSAHNEAMALCRCTCTSKRCVDRRDSCLQRHPRPEPFRYMSPHACSGHECPSAIPVLFLDASSPSRGGLARRRCLRLQQRAPSCRDNLRLFLFYSYLHFHLRSLSTIEVAHGIAVLLHLPSLPGAPCSSFLMFGAGTDLAEIMA
jgi:hypothetical protein